MATIAVVGAGFAGMSAAARLAKLGHDVTVFDAADRPGGRLNGFNVDGVTWQTSSMSVTLPGVFRDLFRKSGRVMSAVLDITPAAPRRHYFVGRGEAIELDLPSGTRSAQHDAVMAAFGRDPWSPWVDTLADEWDTLRRFIFDTLATHDDVVALDGRISLSTSMHRSARKGIKHRQLEALANDRWRLFGADPRQSPASWHVWHYVERNFGRWRFEGDTAGLAQALIKRLGERKVNLHLGTPIVGVQMKLGRVMGIQTADDVIDADYTIWASGESLPGLVGTEPFRPKTVYTGIELRDHTLPQSGMVHGSHLMHFWDSGPQRWVAATREEADVPRVLKHIGVPAEAIVALTPLPSFTYSEQFAETSGSGLNLDMGTRIRSTRVHGAHLVPRPAIAPAPGLYVVGGSAVARASLEVTGMGTATVAQAIGGVPRKVAAR